MDWINNYQLFLFDLDGLLVNTEYHHYQAYQHLCAKRGFHLNWTFDRYSQAAHHSAHALKEQIYAEFPDLYKQEPNWSVLYAEKKQLVQELFETTPIPLMPGVNSFLKALQAANINCCVVTHSALKLTQLIRKSQPILESIPHWITRENYTHPKPHPEGYQYAIDTFAKPQDTIIGFEDSPRGYQSLLQTKAKPVLICKTDAPYLAQVKNTYPNVCHYSDFNTLISGHSG